MARPASAAPLLATWLYAEREGEESVYPQVGGRSSSTWFQAIYWRCVASYFATAARTTPGARLVLYTNVGAVPDVDGHDVSALLAALDVEVVARPFAHAPPPGYFGAWRNQFYVLDLLGALAETLDDDDVGVLLDSDCLWTRPADPLAAAVRRHGALTLDVALGEDEDQNGLTRRQMGTIYADLDGVAPDGVPPYVGGELLAVTGRTARRMAGAAEPVWDVMARRHEAGLPKFNEEAHLLSYVYHRLGVPVGTADPFAARIYTSLKDGKTVRPEHAELMVWHLPNEKRYGFRRLFPAVVDRASWFWTLPVGGPWRARLGATLGVPRRTPAKAILDVGAALRDKLTARLRG